LRFLGSFRHRRGDPRFLDSLDVDGDDRVWITGLQAFVRRLGTRLNP
jgi:hypothetical protein